MEYNGSFPLFDSSNIKTYPLKQRINKVSREESVNLEQLRDGEIIYPAEPWFRSGEATAGPNQSEGLRELAKEIVDSYRNNCPVMILSGAHPIKNGLNPIVIDLIRRGIVTSYVTNGAGTIHSLELALTGESSESVRDSLPKGEFGMAFETGAFINFAIKHGRKKGFGYGESMGRLFKDREFRTQVLDNIYSCYTDNDSYYKPYDGFPFVDECIFGEAFAKGIPSCICSSIGTDIIDQHPDFCGETKGWASGADFLIFTEEVSKFTRGGVVLNIGTAIMGPEVLLKAASMVTNVGKTPKRLITADFDIRPFVFDDKARDESNYYYYLRDQKSIATRIPKVFGGTGYYFQGQHGKTIPVLYQLILEELGER
jgi:hypothetical protein